MNELEGVDKTYVEVLQIRENINLVDKDLLY